MQTRMTVRTFVVNKDRTKDIALAKAKLQDAIALHKKHMNGTAPTTGAAGEESQQAMMDMMVEALSALTGESSSRGDMASMNDAVRVNKALIAGAQVRVNIRTLANSAAIRREKRNGRDVIIVPSATLPDDIVMNSILYPADEIENSFKGLERTPAPLGHPTINGAFVSAKDPEGINLGWIGAWNENVRRENGRVFLDKVIDVARAKESEGGRRVLNAIEKGEPVHTSTGLYCIPEAANGAVDYKYIARNIEWDHDAILLDEEGAATPAQGVGMMVNAQGEQQEIEVINSAIEDEAERELGWAVKSAVRALEERRKAPLYERAMKALTEAILGSEREPSEQQNKDADMTVSKEQFDALSAKVDTLSANGVTKDDLSTTLNEALKPLLDAQAEAQANQKAKDDAELADLQAKIVKANILDETAAKELTLNAARELAKKAEPGKAAGLNGAFKGSDDKPAYQLPKGDE